MSQNKTKKTNIHENKKMFVFAVDRALKKKRVFDTSLSTMPLCSNTSELLNYLPTLFDLVDNHLFEGGIKKLFERKSIEFHMKTSHKGPAGMTIYDAMSGMQIVFNKNAWVSVFPAMVGGNLCTRADKCITQTFFHEMVHVVLFCVYLDLDMTQDVIERTIPSKNDPTHNVIFTTWLERFFHQTTIDNSLLLQSATHAEPLRFHKDVSTIEKECLQSHNKQKIFYEGIWQEATVRSNQKKKKIAPHHSRVRTKTGQNLVIPNGLVTC